ncbi:MAG: class I tRNA ligase family protein, partial [Clostridia bacterium]|nr:class I tRNA ligase family protein [Clostridia bacterium]
MSKSRGNVINPDDVVNEYGADTFRTYEMFIGAFDQATPWSMNGVKGCYKFLERVWNLQNILVDGDSYSKELETSLHKTIKKVTDDYNRMKFNTGIAALMAFINDVMKVERINKAEFKTFITLLNPVAPHITEELWQLAGFEGVLSDTTWPVYDEAKTVDDEIEVVVQINGKIRDKMMIAADLNPQQMQEVALGSDKIKALIDGKQVVKVIAVPKKLINIVVK